MCILGLDGKRKLCNILWLHDISWWDVLQPGDISGFKGRSVTFIVSFFVRIVLRKLSKFQPFWGNFRDKGKHTVNIPLFISNTISKTHWKQVVLGH